MSWSTPKTNWDTHPKAIEPADLNRIERNIEVVREQDDLPLRAQVVSSLPSPGTPGRLVFNDADKRFYFDTGTSWQVQSAPNLGKVILTPGTEQVPIPEGYHNGTGYVVGDSNLIPTNIIGGVTVFGVQGSTYSQELYATTSSTIRHSFSNVTIPYSKDGVPQRIKEIKIGMSGTIYAYVYGSAYGERVNLTFYVGKNGKYVGIGYSGGTSGSSISGGDSGYIDVEADDLIQVFAYTNSDYPGTTTTATLSTFRIRYDIRPFGGLDEVIL